MRRAVCGQCGGAFSTNEMAMVLDQALCVKCAEERLNREPELRTREGAVAQVVDPTVCVRCGADHGEIEWEPVAGMPMCEECAHLLRHYPFPRWVKAAALTVVALVAVAFYVHRHQYSALFNLVRAERAAMQGDWERASQYSETAAQRVPGNADLQTTAAAYKGMWLATQEKMGEALPYLHTAAAAAPPDAAIHEFIVMVECGAAFDAQDYDKFLAKERQLLERDPDNPIHMLGVASAYACQYAVSGEDRYRQDSEEHIRQAGTRMSDAEPAMRTMAEEYTMRIRHRLATREIISQKEFQARYPDGWTEGSAP